MAQQERSSISKEPEYSNLFLCQAWNVNLNYSPRLQLKPSVTTSVGDYLVLQKDISKSEEVANTHYSFYNY